MLQIAMALLIQEGKYVVQKRDDIPTIAEPGKLSLWGGALEGNETPEEAVIREIKEETGVIVPAESLKLLIAYETIGRSPRTNGLPVMAHLYAVEINSDVVIECFEGQSLERITSAQEPESVDFLVKAIGLYEQQQS